MPVAMVARSSWTQVAAMIAAAASQGLCEAAASEIQLGGSVDVIRV